VCGWGDTSVDTIDLQTDHSPESASDANVRSPGNLAQPIDAADRVMITIVNHRRHASHNLRDFNGDGKVHINDYNAVRQRIGTTPPPST
jgi:hypothetical protein